MAVAMDMQIVHIIADARSDPTFNFARISAGLTSANEQEPIAVDSKRNQP